MEICHWYSFLQDVQKFIVFAFVLIFLMFLWEKSSASKVINLFLFFSQHPVALKFSLQCKLPHTLLLKKNKKKFLFLLVWKEEFATRGQFVMKKVHKCFLLNLEVYSSNSSIPLCNRCFDISCNVIMSYHSPNQLRKPYYKFNQEIIKEIGTKTISIEFLRQSVWIGFALFCGHFPSINLRSKQLFLIFYIWSFIRFWSSCHILFQEVTKPPTLQQRSIT